MSLVHDLSGLIEEGMWSYDVLPGLETIFPKINIAKISSIEKDGFHSSSFSLSSVTGTYLEAGAHIINGGRMLDDYSVVDFIKPVRIVRVGRLKPKELVTRELLEKNAPRINSGDAIIVCTGWYKRWNTPGYVLDCPNYSPKALEWILNRQPSIFGVDVPCIESAWGDEVPESKGRILKRIFETGALLAAPLVNFDSITNDSGTLYCFPMKVAGSSGAPARIVYIEENDS